MTHQENHFWIIQSSNNRGKTTVPSARFATEAVKSVGVDFRINHGCPWNEQKHLPGGYEWIIGYRIRRGEKKIKRNRVWFSICNQTYYVYNDSQVFNKLENEREGHQYFRAACAPAHSSSRAWTRAVVLLKYRYEWITTWRSTRFSLIDSNKVWHIHQVGQIIISAQAVTTYSVPRNEQDFDSPPPTEYQFSICRSTNHPFPKYSAFILIKCYFVQYSHSIKQTTVCR